MQTITVFFDLYVVCGIITAAITLLMLTFSPKPIEKTLGYLLASFVLWPFWPYAMLLNDLANIPYYN